MTFPNTPENCDVSQQAIINTLETTGPITHQQLASTLNVDWDDLTPYMQSLRQRGVVINRIDRRYELTTTST